MCYELISVVSGSERARGWSVNIAGVRWVVPETETAQLIVVPRPSLPRDLRTVARAV
jgi:hypothetical protein